MHRRAHGGAWAAAALLIGSCPFAAAGEPPRMSTSYTSGTVAPTSKVSTFAPATAAATPATSASVPTAIELGASSGALEIIPTPFVPYASAYSQRGQALSPINVVNVASSPIAAPPATIIGPLVPIELSPEEKSLIEKALRGIAGKPDAPAANVATSSPTIPANAAPRKPKPATMVAADDEEPPVNVAAEVKKSVAAPTAVAVPVEVAKTIAVATSNGAATEEAKITPLPPLEREVPSNFKMPLNLPQPPIPLEFPRTGS